MHFFVAVKALLFYEEKFLVIRRSDAARGEHYFWEFPGGRMEFGETPEEALLREVGEETGLTASCICPIQTWRFFRGEDTQIVGITFLCKATTDLVQLSEEHDAYAWITKDALDQYPFMPSVRNDIEKLNLDALYDKLK